VGFKFGIFKFLTLSNLGGLITYKITTIKNGQRGWENSSFAYLTKYV
jgi:hypothetical protein